MKHHPSVACRFASLFCVAGLVTACGGGSDAVPDVATSSTSSAPADSAAAKALFNATWKFASLARFPLLDVEADVLPGGTAPSMSDSGPCEAGGAREALLDGAPAADGYPLPAGSHSYILRFASCASGGQFPSFHNGTISVSYATDAWTAVTAQSTLSSLRVVDSPQRPGADVTAAGSGAWTYAVSNGSDQMNFSPAAGSTLVNNMTTNVIAFVGGLVVTSNTASAHRWGYSNLEVELNGVRHVLDGVLESAFTVKGLQSFTGEIRITRDGSLVARIYPAGTSIRAEAYAPLVEF